jgi:hypothetical protein
MTTRFISIAGVVGVDALFITSTTAFTNCARKVGSVNEEKALMGAMGGGMIAYL